MARLSHALVLIVVVIHATVGFAVAEKDADPVPLSGGALVPADTLFFMRIPSAERYRELFHERHEERLEAPVLREMRQAASKNPVSRNRPTIEVAPGSTDTINALGALGNGELVLAMLPDEEGELRYVAVVGDLVEDASATFRRATEAAAGLKWEQSEGQGPVWHSEAEGIGTIRMTERSGFLVVGTHVDAFEYARAVESGDAKALASLPLYRKSLDAIRGVPLIAYFSNLEEARRWMDGSEIEDIASLGRLLEGRLDAVRAITRTWDSGGAGSVGREQLQFQLDEDSADIARDAAEISSPVPARLVTPETLGYVHTSVRPGELAELPFFEGLPFGRALRVAGKVRGAERATYVVDAGESPSEAFRGWIIDTNGPASEQVGEPPAPPSKGKPEPLLEKAGDSGFRFSFPLGEGEWIVRAAKSWLVVAPDEASAAHFVAKLEKAVPAVAPVSAWLGIEPPNTLAKPLLEVRVNRTAIMRRVFENATEHYGAFAEKLRLVGFSPPETAPDFSEVLEDYGAAALWVGIGDDSLTVEKAVALGVSGSSYFTATTVAASFVLEKRLLQTMQAWKSAFGGSSGKSSAPPANPFDVLCRATALISPLVAHFHEPTAFLDFVVLHALCDLGEPIGDDGPGPESP